MPPRNGAPRVSSEPAVGESGDDGEHLLDRRARTEELDRQRDVAAIDDDPAVDEKPPDRGVVGVIEHDRVVRDPLPRLGENTHVGRIWPEGRRGGLVVGVGDGEPRDQIDDELQIVGMNELHAVPADNRLVAENCRERRSVPEDLELLVEQQRELAFGATHRREGARRRIVHV